MSSQENRTDNILPQMGARKRQFIENLLLEASRASRPIRVLEWGSGGSTVYFTRFLRRHRISFEWISLEYDPSWYEKVRQQTADDPNVLLVLFDTKGKDPRRRDVPMDEYVSYPGTLGKTFDLVIVDGRKRRRCVLEARGLIAQGGVVLLDDAFRPRYWCAFRAYPSWRFLFDSFWVGRALHPSISEQMGNAANRLVYIPWFYLRQKLRAFARRPPGHKGGG